MEKKIVSCPNCNTSVRVPSGKHVKFVCPTCYEKLEFNDKAVADIQETRNIPDKNTSEKSSFSGCIILILAFIITFPIFIILHKKIPDFDWIINLDRILLFTLVLVIVDAVLGKVRKMAIFLFLGIIALLTYGSIFGSYGFVQLYSDYKGMLYAMYNNPKPEQIVFSKLKPLPHKLSIEKAMDYDNKEVMKFARATAIKHFEEYQNSKEYHKYRAIIQSFSIFKEINVVKDWKYVSDPSSREYFAKASETLESALEYKHFTGDCDDYAIFMASCIKAIGGTPRLVYTNTHLYPEILIGSKSDLDNINYIVNKLFSKNIAEKKTTKDMYKSRFFIDEIFTKSKINLNYHTDEQGQIWLNLDYTAKHPGGKFIGGDVTATWELY